MDLVALANERHRLHTGHEARQEIRNPNRLARDTRVQSNARATGSLGFPPGHQPWPRYITQPTANSATTK